MKGLLNILSKFNNQTLNDVLAERIMGELIKHGLYRPVKQIKSVKEKWQDTPKGEFSSLLLSDNEVKIMLKNNPQNHKEAGFKKGWSSRFATIYDFAKELGFVYYWQDEKIEFSEIGLMLLSSIDIKLDENYILVTEIHSELEQQAFLHAMAKYQRNNPFMRVLNENIPLILLLKVIKKLNADKDFNGSGISKLELPLIIFWKNNDAEKLYKLIKSIRKKHGYSPSWEVIVSICVNEIMGGSFKKFKPKSIILEYPDEFIRKMRLTGLISLRGGGRFIDINKKEEKKVNYILEYYSRYKKFETEREYFDYMAETDKNLITIKEKIISVGEREKFLTKWANIYSWSMIRKELINLAEKRLTKDGILKYLSSPMRLEFLVALAVKSKFPDVKVVPNYPYDDEGLPTSTAGGVGDKGDIECHENFKGVLIEVTMSEGRTQTIMEVWPIVRHLEEFSKNSKNSMCYFIAPSIFKDSVRQIEFVREKEDICILPKTIEEFINHLNNKSILYSINQ